MTIIKNSAAKVAAADPKKIPVKSVKATKAATEPKTTVKAAAVSLTDEASTKEVSLGRKQIAEKICEKVRSTGKAVPLSIAELMLDALDEVVTEALSNNMVVRLGIGKFYTAEVAERLGRNPQTGDPVTINAHSAPKFKASGALKKVLNSEADEADETADAGTTAEA